jgi:hypothetical protein
VPQSRHRVAASQCADRRLKPSRRGRGWLAGHESPTNTEAVKATLRGIRRTLGTAPARKVPAVAETLPDMVKERIREITRRAKGVGIESTMEELIPYMPTGAATSICAKGSHPLGPTDITHQPKHARVG